ncbi:MAG: hypothetical protein AB1483_04490 [Candidatus Zixiibacteriota bacterium]
MYKRAGLLKTVVILALIVYMQALVLPQVVQAQTTDCSFDKSNPTIENARYNFRITNYDCAEQELQALLAQKDLDIQAKADAHVLLASVYYAKIRNNEEKQNLVIEQFVAAFQAFRNWRGDLDIKSPEFMAMMAQAQELVDKQEDVEGAVKEEVAEEVAEATPEVVPTEQIEETPVTVITPQEKKKGPWYKQWWAIGLGVGLVATAVVVAGGGGGGDEEPADNTLPDFPDPPAKR